MEEQAYEAAQANRGIPASDQTAQTTGGTEEGQEEFMADIEAEKQDRIDRDKHLYDSHRGVYDELSVGERLAKDEKDAIYQSRGSIVKRNQDKRHEQKALELGLNTRVKGEKSKLSEVLDLQQEYLASKEVVDKLDNNSFAKRVPKAQEEIIRRKEQLDKTSKEALLRLTELKENRAKDKDWGKTQRELQQEQIAKELYKDDNKILSALYDNYLSESAKNDVKDSANVLKWSEDKKEKVLGEIEVDAHKFIENADIKDMWAMEGITDKNEILNKYIHEKMIPYDLTTILSYKMSNRGFTPGSGSYRQDTEAQEILRELGLPVRSDLMNIITNENALEEFSDVTEEEANAALDRLLVADLMANKGVDPTKIFHQKDSTEYVASRVAREGYGGIKSMFFFGGDQDKSSTMARLSSRPSTGSVSMGILDESGLKADSVEGIQDRSKRTELDAWADGLGTVASILPVFYGSGGAVNLGKSAFKGSKAAAVYADKMVKLEQAALKAKSPMKKAFLNLAVKGERAVTEGFTHQMANWVYDEKDLNIVSGSGGAFAGELIKSILGKYNPSKKGVEIIKNMFARAVGENVEEITEELIQNDFDLSAMTANDWKVMLTMSSLMGGAIGGWKKIESNKTKYSDLAGIAASNLSKNELEEVGKDLGLDKIKESFTAGQSVDLDPEVSKTPEIETKTEEQIKSDDKEIRTEETLKGETEYTGTIEETQQDGGLEGDAKKDIPKEPKTTSTKKEKIKPSESKTAEEEKTRMATETKAIEDSRKAELKQKEGKSKTKEGQEALNRDVNERHDQRLAELKESEKVFNKKGQEVKLTKEEIAKDKEINRKNAEKQPVVNLFKKLKQLNDPKDTSVTEGEVNTLAQELGFEPIKKEVNGKYKLYKKGSDKPSGSPRLTETNKNKARYYGLLSEESHEVQKDFKKLKETGVLDNYTTGEADANRLDISEFTQDSQFQKGMRDIENGVRSFDAQAILDFVNRYNKEGNVPFVTGKGNLQGLHTLTKEQIDLASQDVFKKENLAPDSVQEFISSKRDVESILDPEQTPEGWNDLSIEDQDLIYDVATQLRNQKGAVLDNQGNVFVFNYKDLKKGEVIEPKTRKKSESAKKIERSEVIPPEFLENLSEEGKKYNVLSDAQATKDAVDYINKFDSADEAAKIVIQSETSSKKNDYNKLPGKTKVHIKDAIALTLLNEAKLLDETNDPFKVEKIEVKMNAINDLLILRIAEVSSAAQTLQGSKNIVDLMFGDGTYLQMKANSDISKSIAKGHLTHKSTKKVLKELSNANKEVVSEEEFRKAVEKEAARVIKERKKAQAKLDKAKKGSKESKKSETKERKKAQAELDKAKNDLGNLFDKAAESFGTKKSLHGEESISLVEIMKELKPILVRIADSLIKLGHYNFKEWKTNFDKHIDKKFDDELKKAKTPEQKEVIRKIQAEAKSKSDEIWGEKEAEAKKKKAEYAENNPEKAIRKELKDMDESGLSMRLEDVVKRHYTDINSTKDSLIQKIMDDIELDEETATKVAENLSKKFTELATIKKEQILDRTLGKKRSNQSGSKQDLYKDVIKLSNLGALTESDLDEELNKYLLITTLNADVRFKLNELAEEVQTAKGENARREAIYDVTDYMNNLEGLDKTNMILSGMLGGLFAGPSTQALNVKSNFWTGFYEPLIHALSKLEFKKSSPKNMLDTLTKMTYTWWKGLPKGTAEASHILRTGKIVHKGVVGQKARILEVMRQLPFEQLKQNAFSRGLQGTPVLSAIPAIETALMKMSAYTGSTAFRALGAMDAVFTMGGETSFRAAELQLEYNKLVARNPNSKNAEIIKEMLEHMHPSSEIFNDLKNKKGEAYKDIKEQYFKKNRKNDAKDSKAEEKRLEEKWENLVEGKHGFNLKEKNRQRAIKNNIDRRAWEILNEKTIALEEKISSEDVKQSLELSKKMATDLSDYAAFVGKPLGAAGILAKAVNLLLNQAPALKVYIPVVNTVVNVLNKQLDATPIGALSVLNAKLGISKGDTQEFYTKNAKNIIARSALGTAQMVGLFAFFARFGTEEDEDESNLFERLTGYKVYIHGSGPEGWAKKSGMQDKGWLPYSIQIGDKYFSYTTSPFAAGFTALGNFNDKQRYEGIAPDDAENRSRLIYSFLAWNQLMAEGSSVNTTKDLLAAFSKEIKSDNKLEMKIMKSVSKTLGMFLPGGNFVRQVGKFVDSGEQVDRNSWKGALAYILPGSHHLIDGVGVQLAWDGTPVRNYPGMKQWWTTTKDSVDRALLEAQIEFSPTRRTDVVFNMYEEEDILVGASEKMYFDYAKFKGKRLRELSKEYLEEIQELDLSTKEGREDRDSLKKLIQTQAITEAKYHISEEYGLTDFD